MPIIAAAAVGVGALIPFLLRFVPVLMLLLSGAVSLGAQSFMGLGLNLLFPLAYAAIMAGTVYTRLRGIRL